MRLAIAEAKRARDRGDYPIGAVITRVIGKREVVIASAGNRVKTSGSSIKHVELETLKYVSSGYGRYLPDFVLYSTHEPCAMCAGACVWSKIGAVVFGVSQEDITAYGKKHGTDEFKWRACLISCKFVLEKGGLRIPVFGKFLKPECRKLFGYRVTLRASPSAEMRHLDPDLRHTIEGGFANDDAFDCAVRLAGMLEVLMNRRGSGESDEERVRTLEGWILGQSCAP
jgi:tRNA(Arg) A34 adenosine deaminase TadA